ncbi:dipeptide epimerase [Maribrevibacterium harenarium]|uniref:Dipeptide epimerase n=1 Tax=Maribrevibacterium harenarium TaxID=2589817 RepID=A0A501WCC7_9GAMM|nr:N-acetyl-D-Glu racemase DgcA [Maribrevibacterium harenarium]TPE46472.1 dipeptide epimerase [Maribrevibacterium harenarium]
MRRVEIRVEKWPLHEPFIISRIAPQLNGEVVVVEIEEDGLIGRGECERMDVFEPEYPDVLSMVESVKKDLEHGINREQLQQLLPSGAARNAVDCALFELDAKQSGHSAWKYAGFKQAPKAVTTVFTLSLGEPDGMAKAAKQNNHLPILKLKLGTADDMPRVRAVRAAAPDVRLVIDANTGWCFEQLKSYLPELQKLGIEMVEQPLPPSEEHLLSELDSDIPIVADESCIDRTSLASLKGRYQGVNIKLDKTGGMTEALALLDEAKAMGFEVMVGCMLGTSLAMAPALLLAQEAQWVDIDGPLLLSKDRTPGLSYSNGVVTPVAGVWG